MANFRRKASVSSYDDYTGTVAADQSGEFIDSFTCGFFRKYTKDANGRFVDYSNKCVDAVRVWMREDTVVFDVDIRLRDLGTQKSKDYSFMDVAPNDLLLLFKRFEMVLKRNLK